MTTRSQSARANAEAEEDLTETSITMGQRQLQLLLQTFQQSQADFCTRMLQEIRTSTPVPTESPSAVIPNIAPANFSRCTARFNGTQGEEIESFIDAVEVYKTCLNISDENAVRGLSMLLQGAASVWWIGVRDSTKTWSDALTKLRYAYGERRPPFRIYRDLFTLRQGQENTDKFLAKARSLLAKLPRGELSEKIELDMVFGLLDRRIRKRVDRDSILTFDDLSKRARSVEESLVEAEAHTSKSNEMRNSPTTVSVQSPVSTSTISTLANTQPPTKPLKRIFCRRWGHEKAECRRLQAKETVPSTTVVPE